MRIISVWMKSDDDSDDAEFEFSWELTLTDEEAKTINSGKFKFTKPLHHLLLNFIEKPNVTRSGVIWFETKVRRIGTDSWLSQRYPIIGEFKN
jgi:hypothetical protein